MVGQPFVDGIRGVAWYQGESNTGQWKTYHTLFPVLISSWRKQWGIGDFPFLYVQLAPFGLATSRPQESTWANLREAQLLTLSRCKNTAMAVITDVGDEHDIHPRKKAVVGERLGMAAEALAYGVQKINAGPVFDKMEMRGRKVYLSLDRKSVV